MKILFVTSIITEHTYKNFDQLYPFETFGEHDFHLYTNNTDLLNVNTGWKIIYKSNEEIETMTGTIISPKPGIIKQRLFKFMIWKYIDTNIYDMIVYCDGYMAPKCNANWKSLCKSVKKHGIIQTQHKKSNVLSECDNIGRARKDTRERTAKTKEFLISQGCPDKAIMMANTAFMYDPKNRNLHEAFQYFWDIYSVYNLTYRDQPLWGFVQWKKNIKPSIIRPEHRIDFYRSNFHIGIHESGLN